MEEKRENSGGDAAQAAPASDLSERLARRASVSPGVVDVSAPRQHYARTAGWVARKFSLVNRVLDRYGVADARPAAQPSFVMRSSPQETEEVDELRRVPASYASPSGASSSGALPHAAPAAAPPNAAPPAASHGPFAPPTAEQLAARAVMLTPQPADSPAQAPGDSTAPPPAAQGGDPKASGDARTEPPTPSSGVRVRRAGVRSAMHGGPGVLARVAAPSRPANSTAASAAPPADARGGPETAGADPEERPTAEPPVASGEASPEAGPASAASFKAEPSSGLEDGAGRPALLMRKAPAAALREGGEGGEGGGAEALRRTETQPTARAGGQETASVSSGAMGSGATGSGATAGTREGASATASEASAPAASQGGRNEGAAASNSSPASPAPAAASRNSAGAPGGPAAASREVAPGESVRATGGVRSASAPGVDAGARAGGGLLMRSGDKGATARPRAQAEGRGAEAEGRGAEAVGQAGRVQPPLVKATAGPSLLRAKASAAEARAPSSPAEGGARPLLRAKSSAPASVFSSTPGAAVETAPAPANEAGASGPEGGTPGPVGVAPGRGPAPQSNVTSDAGGRASVKAAEITARGATRADAGMVWRRTADAAPQRANTTSSTGVGAARALMRQDDGGSGTTTMQTASDSAGPAAEEASAPGIDVGEIAEQVIRTISRRMAVERERRGFRK